MGRAGGNYEQSKTGKRKRLDGTKAAKPVDGKSTRIEEQEAAAKAAPTQTGTKE